MNRSDYFFSYMTDSSISLEIPNIECSPNSFSYFSRNYAYFFSKFSCQTWKYSTIFSTFVSVSTFLKSGKNFFEWILLSFLDSYMTASLLSFRETSELIDPLILVIDFLIHLLIWLIPLVNWVSKLLILSFRLFLYISIRFFILLSLVFSYCNPSIIWYC